MQYNRFSGCLTRRSSCRQKLGEIRRRLDVAEQNYILASGKPALSEVEFKHTDVYLVCRLIADDSQAAR